MIRLENLKVYADLSKDELFEMALKKANIRKSDLLDIRIVKKSIDARNKKDVHYIYTFDVKVKDEKRYPKLKSAEEVVPEVFEKRRKSPYRPVIVGSGPAGLFCALTLIEYGYRPIIVEQGSCVEERAKIVEEYRTNGKLNPLCNVQFGEGGAGAFSDGKLTTNISSSYIKKVLDLFYQFGAPEEVTYLSKPHIGTDNLYHILIAIRKYITERGGEYRFNTRLTDFKKANDVITVITDKEEIETDTLVLAIGHSARTTFKMLKDKEVELKRKNFSVGVRAEHLQSTISESQYGTYTRLQLPPAEYKLAEHFGKRTCYTFCMCPGGEVIASSSDEGSIVTNGMSHFKRDGLNANAALLVNVNVEDLEGDDVLEGMYFQEALEKKAFVAGGSNGYAPIQRIEDFMKNRVSDHFGRVTPTYIPGTTFCDLNEILPDFVCTTLKQGIQAFDRKIKGYNDPDGLLTGVETRTSSPVTIVRNEQLMSSVEGVYPCGEGAGYAGGITSAAVDGIRVAKAIIEKANS